MEKKIIVPQYSIMTNLIIPIEDRHSQALQDARQQQDRIQDDVRRAMFVTAEALAGHGTATTTTNHTQKPFNPEDVKDSMERLKKLLASEQEQPRHVMASIKIRESGLAMRREVTKVPRQIYQPNFLTRHCTRWIKHRQDQLNKKHGFRHKDVPVCYFVNPSILDSSSKVAPYIIAHPTIAAKLRALIEKGEYDEARNEFERGHRK